MILNKISNFKEVMPNDFVVIVNNGMLSIDEVKSINYETGHYEYINIDGKPFQGNLVNFLELGKGYISDKDVIKYTNKELDNSYLSIDGLFTNLFNCEIVTELLYSRLQFSRTDIYLRVKFIDFVEENRGEIFDIIWSHDEELRKSDKRLDYCFKLIKEKLDKLF